MDHQNSRIPPLMHQWDKEDAARDAQERQAKQAFWEQQGDQIFAPIKDHLTKLGKVLDTAANASVEIGPRWEHLSEHKLRRVAKVILRTSRRRLAVELTIEGPTIFYRDTPYRFSSGIKSLLPAITSDVEQFITGAESIATPATSRLDEKLETVTWPNGLGRL